MIKTTPEQNKTLVLQAFDTLFNKRDYNAAERYWSSNYIQHSAHIAPGRDGLFNLVRSTPPTLKYEPGLIVAENDYVIVHGRFSGTGRPRSWIAADVVRVADGVLAEHWDVLQDLAENLAAQSMTDLAERGSLGVRELQPPLQLGLQDAIFDGQIFNPRQQLLVHHRRDEGQNAHPRTVTAPIICSPSIPTNTEGPHNASNRKSPKSASKGKTPRLETTIRNCLPKKS
jgi:predicted SnoaL-like aldol condensation-catalyzing enzyme